MTNPKLGLYLAKNRTERGISQQRLADAVGISRPYLTQIENGTRTPSEKVLQNLIQALGIPLDQAMRDLLDPAEANGLLQHLGGPLRGFTLMQQYLTPAQMDEIAAAFGTPDDVVALAHFLADEEPLPPGPDRWTELTKSDQQLIQRLINRILGDRK